MRIRVSREVAAGVLAGFVSGLAGALLFATMHALIIVPIWNRLGTGPLFGTLTGAAAGWAFSETHPGALRGTATQAAAIGAQFGATLWLLVTPVTVADALLRVLGIAPRLELVAVFVAITLAIGIGALYGWRITHRKAGAISCAVAATVLTIAMAGPVPVGRSVRAFGIFLAVLPASVIGGVTLALIARSVSNRSAPPAEKSSVPNSS